MHLISFGITEFCISSRGDCFQSYQYSFTSLFYCQF